MFAPNEEQEKKGRRRTNTIASLSAPIARLGAPAPSLGWNPRMQRLFIALEISKPIKDKLTLLQQTLKASASDVKWVAARNMHITLRFLGDLDKQQVASLQTGLGQAFSCYTAREVQYAGLGYFPPRSRPRVLWVGARADGNWLLDLAQTADQLAQNVGLEAETRPFRAHVTLGRVRSARNMGSLLSLLREHQQVDLGSDEGRTITLYESKLSPKGPQYTVLQQVRLQTPGS